MRRAWLLATLAVTIGIAGCIGDAGDGDGTGTAGGVEPGCSQQQVSGQLTPENMLALQAEAKADGAAAQVDIEHAGQGEITFVLETGGEEVWRDTTTQPVLRYGNNANNLAAGPYTLTASVEQGIHQVTNLWLNITWGGASC